MRLEPETHHWMTGTACVRVMDALSPDDQDTARFVGGCVRNSIMDRDVDDIDIATIHTPDQTLALLNKAQIKAVPTGIEHGTITAVAEGQAFEITSLRSDVQTLGRKAVVKFTTDWTEDAHRRDFRLNAIYARRDGSLFDPVDGIEDARSGNVVFIGDAGSRIREDHLRILRFYRFNAWYGRAIDPDGHAACVALREKLRALSAERVWKEIKKLLRAPNPTTSVKAMQEGHVINEVLPGDLDFKLFASIIERDRGKSRAPDAILRLSALLGRSEDAMRAVLDGMKASKAETAQALAMTQALSTFGHVAPRPGMSASERARAAFRIGASGLAARLRLDEAQGLGPIDDDLAYAECFQPARLPIKGKDLIAMGVPAGPQIGELLERLEDIWIESEFRLDHDALVSRARSMLS